ncbi:hypothetical protein [Flexivirga alba]|uniref:DUF202 domain-containing protein n=1 Tax=Flexivirga alba TaxID=702742 RepID=A0ABW2ABB1_9MICO
MGTALFAAIRLVALLAAAWVRLNPRRWSFLLAGLVAAVAAVAVITHDLCRLRRCRSVARPVSPTWAAPGKTPSSVAEVCSTVLAIVGICAASVARRRSDRLAR